MEKTCNNCTLEPLCRPEDRYVVIDDYPQAITCCSEWRGWPLSLYTEAKADSVEPEPRERLTKIDGIGQNEMIKCFGCGPEKSGYDLEHCGYCEHWQAVLDRLAAYEDADPSLKQCSHMTDNDVCKILSSKTPEGDYVQEFCIEGPCPYDDGGNQND